MISTSGQKSVAFGSNNTTSGTHSVSIDKEKFSLTWEKLSNKWINSVFAQHEASYMLKNGSGKAQDAHYRIAKLHP
jgi:hypothetical protein